MAVLVSLPLCSCPGSRIPWIGLVIGWCGGLRCSLLMARAQCQWHRACRGRTRYTWPGSRRSLGGRPGNGIKLILARIWSSKMRFVSGTPMSTGEACLGSSAGVLLIDLAQAGFREPHRLCVSTSGVDEEVHRRGIPGCIAFWSW